VTVVASRQWRDGRVAIWVPAAIAAGTAGNLVDRVIFGAVRDWLAVGPIRLNVADLLLAVGIPIVVIVGIRRQLNPATDGRG
jgi:lipoprotein signal peptidase